MASTQASRGFALLFAIVGFPSIVRNLAGINKPNYIVREVVGIIGAITLVIAATVVWIQVGNKADVSSGEYISMTATAPT